MEKSRAVEHSLAFRNIICLTVLAVVFAIAQKTMSQVSESSPISERPIIVNTDLVTFNVSVIDSEGFSVTDLDKRSFEITDNKQPQQIAYFSDADLPVSVGIVFDVSGSMSGKKIARAQEALSTFIQTSHPQDEYFLIDFNSQPQLLLDKTRDGDAVVKKLTFVEPTGSTALYDAVYLALDRVTRGTHSRRVILIISDGEDNNSRYTFSQLRRALGESDVAVYAVGIDGGMGGKYAFYGELLLEELTSVSGGRAFFPRSSNRLNEIFEEIALELRHQYSIGFRPSNFTSDGKWHRVTVKVTPPNDVKRVFVRHREGYYAVAK
jgi:Ca-activated chloride channel family protein